MASHRSKGQEIPLPEAAEGKALMKTSQIFLGKMLLEETDVSWETADLTFQDMGHWLELIWGYI